MKVKLEDVCEILDNKRIPVAATERKEGIYPYYGANGLQGTIDNYIFDDELVLLAEDGGNFGSKVRPIAYRVSGKCWVNNHAHVLKPKSNINVDYLCYSLMFYDVSSLVNGATRKKLTQTDMRKMTVQLLPMDEQMHIVSCLNKLSNLHSLRHQQLEKLDLLVKSRFVEMFGDPILNNKQWKIDSLVNVTNKIGSGATPKGGKESYQAEGISLIRSLNVHDGGFEYDDLAHITDAQAKELDNVKIEKNDVFINITGASVARSCIVPDNVLPARVNQHVSIVRCKPDVVNYIFINQMFLNTSYKKHLLAMGEAGGATRQAITKQQLEKLVIIVPPLELQNQFATFVHQVDKSKFVIKQSIEKLELLKNKLMQDYFG